ncbi:type II toxin-antitoxin system VapC family toxin [Zeimonas arvi]|uniref:type II toxin-antitoxin system VapC family toxin n=1 Tax=Zeimonas arvi TaxID=2498847 RepID=UPI00164EDAE7|nr:PIN domain-containing protein [Zeimonas arvi]
MIDWNAVPDEALLLVDTAPLIYHLESDERFGARFAGLFEASASGRLRLAISTVSLAEVLTGPFAHGRDVLARQIENALCEHRVVALTPEIAVEAARLRARYRLRLPDAVQLATTLQIDAWGLVTYDRDFSRIEDVRIIS